MNLQNNFIKFPEIGNKVLCSVLKASFTQAILKIIEIEDTPSIIDYIVILKGNSVGEEIYVCDSIKEGDIIKCIITSFSDNGIYVTKL